MKIKQILIKTLMITIVAILGIGSIMPIFAANEKTRNLSLEVYRYVDGKSTQKGYKLNIHEDILNHPIYQIMSENGDTNYYCLNAEEGTHWKTGETAEYNKSYDLGDRSKREEIFNDTKVALTSRAKEHIEEILWILENMYISNSRFYVGTAQEKDAQRLEQKNALLAKAGLVYTNTSRMGYSLGTDRYIYKPQLGFDNYLDRKNGEDTTILESFSYGYYVDVDGQQQALEFPDELVEVAQQAALWYFTNCDTTEFQNRYDVKKWGLQLKQTENAVTWTALEDIDENDNEIGKMKQDMATILCWYLIDAAEKYAAEVENSQESAMGNPLTITPSTANINEKKVNNKDYYVVGPIEINENRTMVYSLNDTFYINEDTNTSIEAYISDAEGNSKSDQKIKNYVGNSEFYIAVPKSKVDGNNIKISFSGNYKTNSKTLWINASVTEQPIVEVVPSKENFYLEVNAKIEPNKEFDLALRKKIIGINGNTKLLNEKAMDASRGTALPNIENISNEGTARYYHRKDPVVVEKGDIIKYSITIYNEGDMPGYAKTFVDKLPTGLILKGYKAEDLETKNGKYKLGNIEYTYKYNPDNNTIEFTNVSKNELDAFDGSLDFETIEFECEVTQAPSSLQSTYLTNIAYITGAYNTETNQDVITDRDSSVQNSPSNYNQNNVGAEYDVNNWYHGGNNHNGNSTKNVYNDTDNNKDYFQGREDDDDFEIVVVKPAAFDLALQKYISKIYSSDGKTSKSGRSITAINTEGLLNNPRITTAEYTISPNRDDILKVKTGEYVLYTFDVFNEGDLDAYVTEITDNIPTGLQFVGLIGNEDERKVLLINSDGTSSEEIVSNDIYEKVIEYNGTWSPNLSKDKFNGEETISIKYSDGGNQSGIFIKAYDKEADTKHNGTGLSKVSAQVLLRVSANDGKGKTIRNEAAITGATDREGNVQDVSELRDRDSQTKPVDNITEPWPGKDGDKNYQDDESYDNIRLEKVDLALAKFITAVSKDANIEEGEYLTSTDSREPQINTNDLKEGRSSNAIVVPSSKTAYPILENSYVLYNIRVYNEGDCDVYAGKVADYLPENLDYVKDHPINTKYGWHLEDDKKTIWTEYLSKSVNPDKKLKAFDGEGLDYEDLQVVCQINSKATENTKLVNSAEITVYQDENGKIIPEDVDSQPNNLQGKNQEKREQDDDDYEVVTVLKRKVDIALTKFIVAISDDSKIEDGEYLTKNKNAWSATNPYDRQTAVDTTPLKDATGHDADYNPVKTALSIPENSYVLYNIRVYNEGDTDVYAAEVKDYLPTNLDPVTNDEVYYKKYGWSTDDGKTIKTTYLSDKILKAFDREKDNYHGEGLDYEDLQILCKVNSNAPDKAKLINSAEITVYKDENGNVIPEDVDSQPNNLQGKNQEKREQDDDDFEVVEVAKKKVDLALKKFIAAVSNDSEISDGEYLTADGKEGSKTNLYSRAPSVDTKSLREDPNCSDATYYMVKDEWTVPAQSYVLYNIRVYNEGETDVYAGEVTDHLPEFLEYVENSPINQKFRWNPNDGRTISTKILSCENGTDNLLKAFNKKDPNSELDYRDLQILCKVSDKAPTNTKIVNIAEITKYEDENGNSIPEDIDSKPNNVSEKNEDDDDYETVLIKTFDLSLLKYVTEVYVTEDGKTTTTQTGNTGDDNKDIIPKVEVHKKKLNSTVVKFGYTIKVTNEGEIEGYAKEITDYVPQGLKFYGEDNEGWTDEGENVISTRLLENTLLKPGESAEVKVILRWINGSDNLGLKINVAEISEDYNKEGVPDRDSTPDNKQQGEDDIDSAPVLLSIKTGLAYNIVMYSTVGFVMLVILGAGIIAIKKIVL